MADWNGFARTNFFPVVDIEGLKASLKPFDGDLFIEEHDKNKGHFSLEGAGQYGGFPTSILDDDSKEISFDFAEHVMPFVRENFVVITMESGAEKLRYITGYSEAYVRKGSVVEQTILTLQDIYEKAAETFGVAKESIVECAYDYTEEAPNA